MPVCSLAPEATSSDLSLPAAPLAPSSAAAALRAMADRQRRGRLSKAPTAERLGHRLRRRPVPAVFSGGRAPPTQSHRSARRLLPPRLRRSHPVFQCKRPRSDGRNALSGVELSSMAVETAAGSSAAVEYEPLGLEPCQKSPQGSSPVSPGRGSAATAGHGPHQRTKGPASWTLGSLVNAPSASADGPEICDRHAHVTCSTVGSAEVEQVTWATARNASSNNTGPDEVGASYKFATEGS